MSQIFVEEENTVYELDEECLRRKGQLRNWKKRDGRKHIETLGVRNHKNWMFLVLLLSLK